MIAWGDIRKVVSAMAPLYFALGLGYGSSRWWHLLASPEQCAAVNTLVAFFSMPFFTFDFVSGVDPSAVNFRVLAADALAKLLAILAAWAWAWARQYDDWSWPITGFSLATLSNTLVVGVPLLEAMYGDWARELMVQVAVAQSVVWVPLLLLAFELRNACCVLHLQPEPETKTKDGGGDVELAAAAAARVERDPNARAGNGNGNGNKKIRRCWAMARTVGIKVASNPNVYASVLGVAWACAAYRWRVGMPGVVTGALQVMSRTGTGMSMFSMGLSMAQQERMVACGAGLAALGMALRFVAGPAAALAGAAAMGIQGNVLRFVVVQAALPQSIASFVFAKEYGLHADVLSTAVIFGTLLSLPVLIAYYALLDII